MPTEAEADAEAVMAAIKILVVEGEWVVVEPATEKAGCVSDVGKFLFSSLLSSHEISFNPTEGPMEARAIGDGWG